MNDSKFKRLIQAAAKDVAPAPPEDFVADVVSRLRREELGQPAALSLMDQLGGWLPRFAVICLLLLCLSAAAEYYDGRSASITEQVGEVTDQWAFATPGD